MSPIILAIRHAPKSEVMLQWQLAFNAAFSGGSLSAALINLCALLASSIAKSAASRPRDCLSFQA